VSEEMMTKSAHDLVAMVIATIGESMLGLGGGEG
jgi:hypothetical protein